MPFSAKSLSSFKVWNHPDILIMSWEEEQQRNTRKSKRMKEKGAKVNVQNQHHLGAVQLGPAARKAEKSGWGAEWFGPILAKKQSGKASLELGLNPTSNQNEKFDYHRGCLSRSGKFSVVFRLLHQVCGEIRERCLGPIIRAYNKAY